jgi:hypothetical protein
MAKIDNSTLNAIQLFTACKPSLLSAGYAFETCALYEIAEFNHFIHQFCRSCLREYMGVGRPTVPHFLRDMQGRQSGWPCA